MGSALTEFAAKGFDGASTLSIARRVDAHQPQINYHFDSKEALWEAAVEHLFDLLDERLGAIIPPESDDPVDIGVSLAASIRAFVHFAAEHPELNRIMLQEATEDSDRLRKVVDARIRPIYEGTLAAWGLLREAGLAAPIEPTMVHWVIVGAASLPFANAPEVRFLTGEEPTDPGWVAAHADGVVATLLPGLTQDRSAAPPRRQMSKDPR